MNIWLGFYFILSYVVEVVFRVFLGLWVKQSISVLHCNFFATKIGLVV